MAAQPTSSKIVFVQREFVKHMLELRGWVLAFIPDHALADDVIQDAFITAVEKADDFVVGTNFRAWLFAIVRYKLLSATKRRAAETLMFEPEVVELIADTPPAAAPDPEKLELLNECIERLSRRAREAIELRYQHALRPQEVANTMNVSLESANVMLSRARRALQECVARKLAPKPEAYSP